MSCSMPNPFPPSAWIPQTNKNQQRQQNCPNPSADRASAPRSREKKRSEYESVICTKMVSSRSKQMGDHGQSCEQCPGQRKEQGKRSITRHCLIWQFSPGPAVTGPHAPVVQIICYLLNGGGNKTTVGAAGRNSAPRKGRQRCARKKKEK